MSYLQLYTGGAIGSPQTITSRDLGLILEGHQIIRGSVRRYEEIDVPYKKNPVTFDTNSYEPVTIQLDFVFESASVVENKRLPSVVLTDGSTSFDAMVPIIKMWLKSGFYNPGYQYFYCPLYDPGAALSKYTVLPASTWGTFRTRGYLAEPPEFERISNNYGLVTIRIKTMPFVESQSNLISFTSISVSSSPWRNIQDLTNGGLIDPVQHFILRIPAATFAANTQYYFNFGSGRLYFTTGTSVSDIYLDTKNKKVTSGSLTSTVSLFTSWTSTTRPIWDVPSLGTVGGSQGTTGIFTLVNASTNASITFSGYYAAYLSISL